MAQQQYLKLERADLVVRGVHVPGGGTVRVATPVLDHGLSRTSAHVSGGSTANSP